MRVQVYKNLHKSSQNDSVYSIRDKSTRLVVDHKQYIVLDDVKFHVSAKGRARVLREKSKNVHAWVEGVLAPNARQHLHRIQWMRRVDKFGEGFKLKPITYNPYKYNNFVCKKTEVVITAADGVIMTPNGIYALAY